ncbi:MAG: sirohydrochlorin cobaltochelatase [Deltaproteobacteria bacterium]|jgi:cobalamin biosynthesis Co2+ chelatase CbiK|nr:sirohydrochlorin cobaltochelatase [Deltaproteobacteria bacterium]
MSLILLLTAAALAAFLLKARRASADAPPPAVILVARGASDPEELEDVLVVLRGIKKAFPCYQERLAFSSDSVRALWRERGEDPAFREAHPDMDPRIYSVGNAISALASVQETGPRLTLVQGLLLTDGPDYYDLSSLVESLRQIKTFDRARAPFPWIGLGLPALGPGEGQKEMLLRTAQTLAPLFAEAEAARAGMVLVADPSGGINPPAYRSLESCLKTVYPSVPLAVAVRDAIQPRGAVEAISASLPVPGPVILATLAPVSGIEVADDLDGPGEDSWGNLLRARGYTVDPRVRGLGSSPLFAELIVENVKRQEGALSRRYMMD